MTIHVKDSPRKMSYVTRPYPAPANNPKEEDTELTHMVLRATMKGGATYAIDITGAQYGFHSPVTSWEDFAAQRLEKTSHTREFGRARHDLCSRNMDPAYLITLKKPAREAFLRNSEVVVEHLDAAFDAWVAAQQMSLGAMMRLSKSKYDVLAGHMLTTLKGSIEDFVQEVTKTEKFVIGIRTTVPNGEDGRLRVIYVRGDGTAEYSD